MSKEEIEEIIIRDVKELRCYLGWEEHAGKIACEMGKNDLEEFLEGDGFKSLSDRDELDEIDYVIIGEPNQSIIHNFQSYEFHDIYVFEKPTQCKLRIVREENEETIVALGCNLEEEFEWNVDDFLKEFGGV